MYRFILVEDDFHIRNGLGRFFPWNTLGFHLVESFENGKKALDFLRVNKVDVVLTDIRMPIMGGLTLARELKKISPETQVIFLTAYRSFDYAKEALDCGVRNYIVKSTKYDDLLTIFAEIRKDLDGKKAFSEKKNESPPEPAVDNRIIRKILSSIDADLPHASLQHLADSVQMNPVYLSRLFKEKTGINFSDYLLKKKMETAALILKETDYSIYEISEMTGYSNDKNFSRAFKKFYGIPPANYRHIPPEGT